MSHIPKHVVLSAATVEEINTLVNEKSEDGYSLLSPVTVSFGAGCKIFVATMTKIYFGSDDG